MHRFTTRFSALLIVVMGFATPVWAAPTEVKLVASDGMADDNFGTVAVSGNFAIVAARGVDPAGAAYIYNFDGEKWVEQQKLTASDGVTANYFAGQVAISGDKAIVGAGGAAYVFLYDGANWVEQQKLVTTNGGNNYFGQSVAISGNYAIIGAGEAAFIYSYDGANWVEQQKLTDGYGQLGDGFGNSVSISDDYAIVSAPGDNDLGENSGTVFVYRYDGATWAEVQRLLPNDGLMGDAFGSAVAISGGNAIIGATGGDGPVPNSGTAYVYHNVDGIWVEQQKLVDNFGKWSNGFGRSVAISDNYAIVNGAYAGNLEKGSAILYHYDGLAWKLTAKITASDAAAADRFGCLVALSGNTAIVGAPGDDDNGSSSGSAYIYTDLPTFPADADGDGYNVAMECNDNAADINPDALEVCGDLLDNDCDGLTDQEDSVNCPLDKDHDGYNALQDCNDYYASINPGAIELCSDGIDNNCDGLIDKADYSCSCIPTATSEKGKTCKDGIDNDCDGLTDFLDPNCMETTKVGGRRK